LPDLPDLRGYVQCRGATHSTGLRHYPACPEWISAYENGVRVDVVLLSVITRGCARWIRDSVIRGPTGFKRSCAVTAPRFSHKQRSEEPLSLVLIVATTAKLEILHFCGTASSKRHKVMDLEKTPFGAAALLSGERALSSITGPDLAPDRGGYVSRAGARVSRGSGSGRCGQPRSFQILDEQRQGGVDDCRWISVGDHMAEEILGAPKIVVRLARDGDLILVEFGRKRDHHRRTWSTFSILALRLEGRLVGWGF